MADKPPKNAAETAPDPDEDDLDDLDDVLDEFQATSITKPKAPSQSTPRAPSASGPGRPNDASPTTAASTTASEDDLAKQLQAGMSSLIGELDSNPSMQAEFEKMMQELIAAGAAGSDQEAGAHLQEAAKTVSEDTKPKSQSAAGSSSTDKKKPAFDSTIRATMDRISASNTAASTASTTAQNEEDLLAQMMKELTEGGMLGGEGGEGGDFNSMLMNMMAHLTNKEILYDPMKELHEKFPGWLEKNAEKTNKQDLERYKEQQVLVGEIVGRFEGKGYSDENEDDREYIVERMQKMQAAGSPPSDLVGDMSAAQEALGGLDQGCPTQ
ncbi:hypothetical protein DOTSEDRAFT_75895 [Dothistroma septosporum NZE10]|uniref:Pex19-domain-containing protein n=1 Tax=Dothistroma septosporum (strain NZE10 / CBS 128990) TaxID=675120 RepID=N1PBN9_DOTSN|nr:hypothetical protein DOTSEDRAFT_75895 [Dothistroma septosporum NZE10]